MPAIYSATRKEPVISYGVSYSIPGCQEKFESDERVRNAAATAGAGIRCTT